MSNFYQPDEDELETPVAEETSEMEALKSEILEVEEEIAEEESDLETEIVDGDIEDDLTDNDEADIEDKTG